MLFTRCRETFAHKNAFFTNYFARETFLPLANITNGAWTKDRNFDSKALPRRKGKLKNARVTKRELNRHRAKESSPNNCAKRAIKGAKNLGMELSLTFKLSVRHIVCLCVPTAQIFVKSWNWWESPHSWQLPFCQLSLLFFFIFFTFSLCSLVFSFRKKL